MNQNNQDGFNRRGFLKFSLSGAGTFFIPSWGKWAFANAMTEEPHFFVQLFVPQGMDNSYLFDARPLDMTKAGLAQNYTGQEPKLWVGDNGVSCFATSIVDPLKAYRNYFSVINGVVMTAAFDGHDQNTNYYFTGNPFGGDSFVPFLNTEKKPIDAVQNGVVFGTFANNGGTVPLNARSAGQVIEKVKASGRLNTNNPLFQFLRTRMQENSTGEGRFSAGSTKMLDAFDQAPSLAQILNNVDTSSLSVPSMGATAMGAAQAPNTDVQFIKVLTELFKFGATRSAIIAFNGLGVVDTHDPASASKQPELFGKIVSKISTLFKTLQETPFDGTRSFLDVTTVMVTSEFGRTLRQPNKKIDETGTDHNPLSNQVLIGGKGIKGGLVIGSSDLQTVDETPSKVHKLLDAAKLKKMGRPFDFSNLVSIADTSDTYDAYKYLNATCVVNTVYSLFGVPTNHYRSLTTNGPAATPLTKLLV